MKINLVMIALIVAVAFLAGCATEPGRVEMDYGVSSKLAKFNQTFDPDAEKNLDPVLGIDGQAAQRSYDQYLKSFEKPEKQPVLQLGVIGQGSK
jgi:hypothetical protein